MSVSESSFVDTSPRVALLARQGHARDQLRGALVDSGAQVALEGDPNELDVQTLTASELQAVLVALEPAIEDALARLDPVLADPRITVIYDEADLASAREGWETQRWVRHLSAKLRGHRDVLPPGAEIETPQSPLPGRPHVPALVEDAALDVHLDEAAAQVLSLPDEPVFGAVSTEAGEDVGAAQPADAFSFDAETWTPPAQPERLALVEDLVFESEPAGDLETERSTEAVREDVPALTPPPVELPSFANLSLVEDFEVATPTRSEPAVPPPLPAGFGHLTLELEALEAPPNVDEPAPDASAVRVQGGVLLLAGIGGPDAVRRVLAGLPASLALPVLVHLRLDGGRYDNLAKQIQRISPLPVLLARAGTAAYPGHVYIVPDDVAVDVVDGMAAFVEGHIDVEAVLGALPPERTAVLVLSGADVAHAEAALMLGARGALVGGQSLQGCYDWAAAKALEQGGGSTAAPEELAVRVIEHLGG